MDYKQVDDGNLSPALIITVLVSTVQYIPVSHCSLNFESPRLGYGFLLISVLPHYQILVLENCKFRSLRVLEKSLNFVLWVCYEPCFRSSLRWHNKPGKNVHSSICTSVRTYVHTSVCMSTIEHNAPTNQIVEYVRVDETFTMIWLSRSSGVRVKVRRWPHSPIGTIFNVFVFFWIVTSGAHIAITTARCGLLLQMLHTALCVCLCMWADQDAVCDVDSCWPKEVPSIRLEYMWPTASDKYSSSVINCVIAVVSFMFACLHC